MARELLRRDIVSGKVNATMHPEHAFKMRDDHADWHQDDEKKKFPERLEQLLEEVSMKKIRATADGTALQEFRRVDPVTTENSEGKPRWEGSDAEKQLKKDIDKNCHTLLDPEELCLCRDVHQVFELQAFRNHIHQETQSWKFVNCCAFSKEKKHQERHGRKQSKK